MDVFFLLVMVMHAGGVGMDSLYVMQVDGEPE